MSESVDESPATPVDQAPAAELVPRHVPAQDVPAQEPQQVPAAANSSEADRGASGGGGPLSLERIRQLRMSQQAAQAQSRKPAGGPGAPRGPKPPHSPAGKPAATPHTAADSSNAGQSAEGAPSEAAGTQAEVGTAGERPTGKPGRKFTTGVIATPEAQQLRPRVAVPSTRQPLSQELELELNAALGASDLDRLLVGDEMLQVGRELTEGQRIQATVMKKHGENVFVSLGGPNEGVIPALSFQTLPEIGAQLDVVVRGYLAQEGLYELTVPGNAVEVSDWADLNEGEVIEALVSGSNAGGLECKVGNIQGFIPASQVAEYRIENLADYVGQKLLCLVTEANPRRGNLVLSHRAVLEREKKEKREERLASLEPGMAVEGVVRKILDFGAFVDIGGVDGLLHVSQLSWERVKHPSELLEEGQKIQVRIDKIDEATGKIGLSYRSLQDHPWSDIDARFPMGAVVRGTVTRIADFGAFVRVATGVEGLVHISELAHHRVQNVSNVVQEGQEVEVKVLAIDGEQQRMSLSLKASQAPPEAKATESASETTVVEEPPPKPALPKHRGPLKGGTGSSSSGEKFGLKW